MSGPDGSPSEMPNFPRPRRFGRPSLEDPAAERLLAALFAAANSPASERELAGEAAAVAAFVQLTHPGSSSPVRTATRRSTMLASALSAKLAVAVAAGAVSLGGVAAAAYTGSLPTSIQNLAHDTIGAPAAHQHGAPSTTPAVSPSVSASPTVSPSPVGPDATGNAKYGLCTAYAAAKAHGTASATSVAFQNLATAAGGASNITTFCAGVTPPGSPSPHPAATVTHPSGAPSSHPSGAPSSLPSGAPSSHPSGAPSTVPPTSHPSGH